MPYTLGLFDLCRKCLVLVDGGLVAIYFFKHKSGDLENAEHNPNEHPAKTDLMCFSTTAFHMNSSINEIMF